ncbi:MAG: hypothetical protein ACLGGX_01075 [Bdellovibrionia bacterium]
MSKAVNHSKRIRPSIRRDKVDPKDFNRYTLMYACEDCSHYSAQDQKCSLGYNAENHRREFLLKMYESSGTMALCRFHEID